MQRFALREWKKGGRIIRWLDENKVDAVFCQGYGDFGRLRLMRWCHRRGIPCFLYGDANVLVNRNWSIKRALKYAVIRRAIAWSRGVMACGTNGRKLFQRCGANPDTMFSFPYLPDVKLFASPPAVTIADMSQRFSLSPERRRLLFSGRLVRDKRPDLLLKAFSKIADRRPNWDLLIVGDGPLKKELAAQVPPRLRHRVVWTGLVNSSRSLAGLFANSDALVLPSKKEPWGVVVVEAAAAGLAIVVSDVVGSGVDLVDAKQNGLIFPSGQLDELTSCLLQITEEPKLSRCRRESPRILREWLRDAEPVQGLRRALESSGVLAQKENGVACQPNEEHVVSGGAERCVS